LRKTIRTREKNRAKGIRHKAQGQGEGSKIQGVRPRRIGEKGEEEGTKAGAQIWMKENRACPKRFLILQILSRIVVINAFTKAAVL
jgi:hypothetical protein